MSSHWPAPEHNEVRVGTNNKLLYELFIVMIDFSCVAFIKLHVKRYIRYKIYKLRNSRDFREKVRFLLELFFENFRKELA